MKVKHKITVIRNIFLLCLFSIVMNSCRCKTDFKITSEKSVNPKDSIIKVKANIWQSQYEYLNIDVWVNRKDSLIVKKIEIITTTENTIFPNLDHYTMITSYGMQDGLMTKQEYKHISTSKYFEDFPVRIRKTNHNDELVFYTISYTDKKKININNFEANIKITLIDSLNQEIALQRFFEFEGNRECYTSAH